MSNNKCNHIVGLSIRDHIDECYIAWHVESDNEDDKSNMDEYFQFCPNCGEKLTNEWENC